jgi:hypothetical protein
MIHNTLRRQATFKSHFNTRRKKKEGRYKRFLKVALFVTGQAFPIDMPPKER